MRKEAAASTLATKIGGPPDLRPLKAFLGSKRAKSNGAASGSLRALGEGGWWTQQRLFNEGKVADPYCKGCVGGPRGPIIGTLLHRCAGCSLTQGVREEHGDQETVSRAQSELHSQNPLYSKALWGMNIDINNFLHFYT